MFTKIYRDKITVFALLLLAFVIGISVGAPWIGDNVLGFSPTKTNLRMRSKPPTWANEAWPIFQEFTRTCNSDAGCDWSKWARFSAPRGQGCGAASVRGWAIVTGWGLTTPATC